MLISLTLENWMSYRDPVKFSMVAGRERHFRERVPKLGNRLRVLPISAIYGANASGKSNFFEAFRFARKFVLDPPRKDKFIPVSPFKLAQNRIAPVSMAFEFESNGSIYSYSFTATNREVREEKLAKIFLDGSEKILFYIKRGIGNSDKRKIVDFSCAGKCEEMKQRLNFILEGTLQNQLFINNANSQRLSIFDDVILWFNNIVLIDPEADFGYGLGEKEADYFTTITEYIKRLDTGIEKFFLVEKKLSKDDIQKWSKLDEYFEKRIEALEEGEIISFQTISANDYNQLYIIKHNGEVFMRKPQTERHYSETNERVIDWDISHESEGTRRALNLLPIIYMLAKKEPINSVYIIDELDRSLHSVLALWFVKSFLKHCSLKTRSQLIFTTHNLQLMDQSFLRRDELWITEREEASSISRMFSINDFKGVRDDTDIRANYLAGVFGGAPRISAELSNY